jgi:hypothetical protein
MALALEETDELLRVAGYPPLLAMREAHLAQRRLP